MHMHMQRHLQLLSRAMGVSVHVSAHRAPLMPVAHASVRDHWCRYNLEPHHSHHVVIGGGGGECVFLSSNACARLCARVHKERTPRIHPSVHRAESPSEHFANATRTRMALEDAIGREWDVPRALLLLGSSDAGNVATLKFVAENLRVGVRAPPAPQGMWGVALGGDGWRWSSCQQPACTCPLMHMPPPLPMRELRVPLHTRPVQVPVVAVAETKGAALLIAKYVDTLTPPHVLSLHDFSHLVHQQDTGSAPQQIPRRAHVEPALIPWKVPFPNYKPSYFVAREVLDATREQSDPEDLARIPADNPLISRLSYEAALSFDAEGYPQNPRGRTGMRGRGKLNRWGPNHASNPCPQAFKPSPGRSKRPP